jgi:hypothetical protein
MPRVGFEPTIPVFERARMVHALDRAATVIRTSLPLRLETVLIGQHITTNFLVYLAGNSTKDFVTYSKNPWSS